MNIFRVFSLRSGQSPPFSRLFPRLLCRDLELRSLFLGAVGLGLLPVELLLAIVFLLLQRHFIAAMLLGVALGQGLLLLAWQRWLLAWQPCVSGVLLTSFFWPVLLSLAMEGIDHSGLVILWSLFAPLMALLLDHPLQARAYLLAFALISIVLTLIDLLDGDEPGAGFHGAGGLTMAQTDQLTAINLVMFAVVLLLMVSFSLRRSRGLGQDLQDFVGSVGHELRSPMATIGLSVQAVQRQSQPLPPRARRHLQLATEQVERCQQLLGCLSSLAMADRGALQAQLQPVHLGHELFKVSALAWQRYSLPCSVLTPRHTASGCTPQALVNPVLLQQILLDLLDNVVKYVGTDSPVKLELSAGASPHTQQIVLEDQGPCLSADVYPLLFERAYRGGNSEGIPGSGLGLYVVRSMLESMGGQIEAEPARGGGSRFVIRLPSA